ncbi:MAG: hypothetical protein COA33_001430 [Fluviicola sp.]|nr:hypothetical protein [Fluviicola sp.]
MESLDSPLKKKDFLEVIFVADQKIRDSASIIQEKYGFNSKEHQLIYRRHFSVDSILFERIIAYLDSFGHPAKEKDGFRSGTIYTVFHHSASSINGASYIEIKQKYFPLFYQAYLSGDVKEGGVWLYLYRLYAQMKKNEYVNYELGDTAQIEEMIDILGLSRM